MGKFQLKKTESGFSFNLVADNNEMIATSQIYATKAGCMKGISSVESNAPFAPIEDQTVQGYQAEENPKFSARTLISVSSLKFSFRYLSVLPTISSALLPDISSSPGSSYFS